jgi:glycosyltransferase involved in cell wall biosynthesis
MKIDKQTQRKLKIFHGLVNYGTQAGMLAKGLRDAGHIALSVSDFDPFKRQIDIELLHGGNFAQKVFKHSLNLTRKVYWFFSFNIFHFYYGTTLLPNQIDLPFYKLFNKKVVFHYLGNDIQGYKGSVEKYKWTNMRGFIGDRDPDEYDKRITKRFLYETNYADKQIVCAPYLSEFVQKSIVLPLAINTQSFKYTKHPQNDIPILMHAPTHRAFKGTNYIIEAIENLKREGYKFIFQTIEIATHQDLKELYIKCDVFIDQIMGGWYGTASIEAMALGRPVIFSLRKSDYEHI